MNPLTVATLAGLLGLAFGSFANCGHPPGATGRVDCPAGLALPVRWRAGVLAGQPARARLAAAGWPLPALPGAHLPSATRWSKLGMGLLWFLVALRLASAGLGWAIPAYLALAFLCVVLAVIDASTRLLPNRITYPAFPIMLGLLLLASIGLGDLGRLTRGCSPPWPSGAFFLLLALISPRGMGLGDVKLAPTLGLALLAGCRGVRWPSEVFAGFLLGGVAGLAAIALLGLTRKSLLPFRSLAGHRRPARRPGRRGRGRLVRAQPDRLLTEAQQPSQGRSWAGRSLSRPPPVAPGPSARTRKHNRGDCNVARKVVGLDIGTTAVRAAEVSVRRGQVVLERIGAGRPARRRGRRR